MSEPSTKTVDHFVYLVAPGALQETSKIWRDLGFTVVPGGKHADGLTENALIAFADGAYIELISFVHPLSHYPPDSPSYNARKNHVWASKHPGGFIDFAFLGNTGTPSVAATINARAARDGSGISYAGEVPGGRERPDGKVLQWLISAPIPDEHDKRGGGNGRGRVPFFCGDLTPRDLRVPQEPSETTHPNASLGIAHLHLLASPDDVARTAKQITTILGSSPLGSGPPSASAVNTNTSSLPSPSSVRESVSGTSSVRWHVEALKGDGGAEDAILLELSAPGSKEEERWLGERGAGIYRVKVRVKEETRYSAVGDAASASGVDGVRLVTKL
ncbi:glyoxalase-like domain-containing protein [Cristinia sonorae]|uniref:Glyoxalase-like domain-containing protein n=1 Tax=Cristinia sonorae TaxID=1940300 RepID=A0A8K0XQ29_9AGAR|nr:glyoxalase-like domain-containing protein [Cristinia sonorae]